MTLPDMLRVHQRFSSPTITDVAGSVRHEVGRFGLGSRLKSGQSVAITVGSRGIRDIALIVRTLVEELKRAGARPFVVPAMGSHGGATADGQRRIVEEMGVTESYTGAPIRSSMDTVQVDSTPEGVPVFFDRMALEADHVVVLNRIKVHSDFTGPIQSGLLKMLLIGLGKHRGAAIYHQAFIQFSFDHILASVARRVIEKCRVLFGLAVVENHNHRTALIEALEPADIFTRERELLELSKRWMATLPFRNIDLLIIDEMGKDIAGSGMDSNVIGRKGWPNQVPADQIPKITRIYVRDLTDASHGNAIGIGMADFAHSRLIDKIDYPSLYTNAITSCTPFGAAIPVRFGSDRTAVESALETIGFVEPGQVRIVRIRNTLELRDLLVSAAFREEIEGRTELQIIEESSGGESTGLTFDRNGNLSPFPLSEKWRTDR